MDRRRFIRNVIGTGTGMATTVGMVAGFSLGKTPAVTPASILTTVEAGEEPFLYILRLALAPGNQVDERTEALLEFCQEAQIDDVAFILWAEELNTGHPTPDETDRWLELVERIKPRLASAGVTTSLNPWVVLQHADRGRTLKEGQNFRLMVDPYGREAEATACPLCPELHGHLKRHYQTLARIHPSVIWVDDDFRLHNHAPLQWGGCFCELHLKEYSRRAGQQVLREEFVKGVLKPGKPHPYRQIWLDASRETMVNLARILGEAVQSVSPETRVGLMSSSPAVHCSEGRDWEGVLRGLAGKHPPVNRPHLPSYTEVAASQYLWNFSRVSRQSVAMVPPDTELYPELENWPHSRFSKSRAFTQFQVESVAALGARGITMDIFDLFGNGALLQEGYGPKLAESKALARRLRGLGLDRRQEAGVQVLFNPLSSETLWTEKGESFSELQPEESFWASFLSVMGISCTYRRREELEPGVVAISGQYFRGLNEDQIRELLSDRVVLLNGDAVATLVDLGLGTLLGIRGVEWHASDSGVPSYEQVIDGNAYAGVSQGRLTAQAATGAYLRVDYGSQPVVHTEVRSPAGRIVGPGMAVVGERVIILPYGRGTDYQGLRHPVRQELLQRLLRELAGEASPVFLRGEANVAVYCFAREGEKILLFVNASTDNCERLRLRCPGVIAGNAWEISRDGVRKCETAIRIEQEDLVFDRGLRSLEVKALVLRLNRR